MIYIYTSTNDLKSKSEDEIIKSLKDLVEMIESCNVECSVSL